MEVWHLCRPRELLSPLCVPCSEEVNAMAKKLHLKLFRASVKEKFNVEEGTWAGSMTA